MSKAETDVTLRLLYGETTRISREKYGAIVVALRSGGNDLSADSIAQELGTQPSIVAAVRVRIARTLNVKKSMHQKQIGLNSGE